MLNVDQYAVGFSQREGYRSPTIISEAIADLRSGWLLGVSSPSADTGVSEFLAHLTCPDGSSIGIDFFQSSAGG
ncbi:MAG TPA: hypothetical protein VF708_08070 [Pyrinomonadaceae bacterium]|jgi:hypothetical protein